MAAMSELIDMVWLRRRQFDQWYSCCTRAVRCCYRCTCMIYRDLRRHVYEMIVVDKDPDVAKWNALYAWDWWKKMKKGRRKRDEKWEIERNIRKSDLAKTIWGKKGKEQFSGAGCFLDACLTIAFKLQYQNREGRAILIRASHWLVVVQQGLWLRGLNRGVASSPFQGYVNWIPSIYHGQMHEESFRSGTERVDQELDSLHLFLSQT